MKYDDASWHYDGDFPPDLPTEAGSTHIGMFVAWCILRDLAGPMYTEEFPDALIALKERRITPGQFLITKCDEKLTDEVLNDEGNAFALVYFGPPGDMGQYLTDYEETLGTGKPTLYHIQDSWDNYEKLAGVIDRRFSDWKDGKFQTFEGKDFDLGGIVDKKPWWKLW